jgi:tetratricopeptide (TPR) repeat protein
VAAGVGRVLIGGKDAGAGVALGRRTVVTAGHVLGRRANHPVGYQAADGTVIPVDAEPEADESLDAAALRLAEDLDGWLPVAAAVEGADWVVDSPPPGNDPTLTGTISKVGFRMENTRGVALDMLQLRVDQLLGDYRGYSGSGVLDRQRRGVVGLLVEQKHLRLPAPPGQPQPASNVLYAVPIRDVVERLGLTVAAARPRRLGVERVLADTVTRSDLLNRLVRKLTGAGPGPVVRVWGLGGMGKTTLVRQALHDARVWQAFPGGIVMVTAGEHASSHEVLADLASKLGIVGLEVREALADDPTLVVVDDVWSSELVAEMVASLPDNVVLAVTTRGTLLEPVRVGRVVESLHVGEMLVDEALGLLARGVSRPRDLDLALAELASVLGYWPLLLSLAASEVHGDELHADELDDDHRVEPPAAAGASSPVAAAKLAANARRLATAFARDPTKLDDPDSQQRSFVRMIERSLGRLSAQTQDRFLQLAVYPADAELAQPVLADLWRVDEFDSRRTVRGLRRVGLVSLVSSDPITIRLHDQLVAWLHHTRGAPEATTHRSTHRRLVKLASSPDGGPGLLTAHRAGWLAFHLCRTGVASDAERLLQERWAPAYRRATGSRSTYLAALREVIDHWGRAGDGEPPGPSEDHMKRWILLGGLLHAHHAALVAEVPADALVAEALLGHADAAMRQAIDDPQQVRAASTLVDIVGALAHRQALTSHLIDLAGELVDRLRNNVAEAHALRGLSSVLAESHPETARRLLDQALEVAEHIQFAGDRATTLASLAVVERDRDPDQAQRLLEQAVEIAEHMPDDHARDATLAGVVEATVSFDRDRAIRMVRSLRYFQGRALAGIARARAAQEPEWAASLADQIGDLDRDEALAEMARVTSGTDPDRAKTLAEQIRNDSDRGRVLATIAQEIAHADPDGALALLTRAVELAEDIRYEPSRSRVLAAAAAAMAGIHPEQAQVLLDRALELAEHQEVPHFDGPARMVSALLRCAPVVLERVTDDWLPYEELGAVAAQMAITDPGRARRLVDRAAERAERRAAEPDGMPLGGLAHVGAVMLAFDSRRADELLERAVKAAEQDSGMWESGDVATPMGRIDWPGARPFLEREARRIVKTTGVTRDYTLGQIGRALAHSDPVSAVELAAQAADGADRSRALTMVATTVIATDHAWGHRLLQQAAHLAERAAGGTGRDLALREVAAAILPVDPARAIELAEQVVDVRTRMEALADLATAMININTEQAAAIAARIDDWARQGEIGGVVAVIDHLTRAGGARARLCGTLSLVWWDLDATLWFSAWWLETTYPAATPPAATTGRAVADMMSRFFPSHLTPQADLAAVDGEPQITRGNGEVT